MKTKPGIFPLALSRHKELAVQRDSVFTFEDHLFGRDQRSGREFRRQRFFGEHLATAVGDFVRHGRRGGRGAQAKDGISIARFDGSPFDRLAAGQRLLRALPPATATRQMWRRSTSPWLEEKIIVFLSALMADVFHIKIARSEQRSAGIPAACRAATCLAVRAD